MKRTALTLVPIAVATASLAAPASTASVAASAPPASPPASTAVAGSIVFVRDHDVWTARADGSGARAVTSDGTSASRYRTPTQAADGTIAAARGHLIVRMTPAGRVLNRIDPPRLENSVGHEIKVPPVNVAISPDGRHIAYTYSQYSCPEGLSCMVRSVTGFTRADRLTDPEQYGTSYLNDPYWLSNTRTVQGGGSGITVNLQDLGHDTVQWFSDYDTGPEAKDLSDPAVSVEAGLYAAVRGYDETTHIAWYDLDGDPVTGAPPAAPSRKCVTSYDESLSDPTFSADGNVLAWGEGADVWASTDPTRCDHQPQVWLRNAGEPSFSPATYVNPAPENVTRPSVAGRAVVGRTLTGRAGAWTPRPSRLTYQWLRNGKAVRGATRATYRVQRADRGRRLSVVVTAGGSGGVGRATSTAVTVRR